MRALRYALGLAGFWCLLNSSGALETLERLTAQARYLTRPAPGFHAPVAVVAIDERSLKRFGQMPWDRRLFARLLDRLRDAHAAVVGMDIAFNEPAGDPDADRALEAAIRRIPTVLPTFMAYADAGHLALQAIDPLPRFTDAAAALGSIQLSSWPQAQVWEVEPYQQTPGRLVPAFPVALVGVFRHQAWRAVAPGFPWQAAPALIDFRGPANSARQFSAADVLAGHLPARALAGHVVLVGATAVGLPDTNFSVPDGRGGPMSGVELSAHVVDNLLAGGFQRRTGGLAVGLLLGLLALGPGRLLARGDVPTPTRTLGLGLALGLWALFTLGLFRVGIWVDGVVVAAFFVSCYLAGLFAERTFLLESRNQLLARYASDIASEAQRQRARIEGELHDGIQQLLVVFERELRQVARPGLPEPVIARLAFLTELKERAYQEVKRLRADLLPPALRYGGLAEALGVLARELGDRGGLAVAVAQEGWEPLGEALELELFWLVKEALNNAEKHAAARHVTIRLERRGAIAQVDVEDDGCGFSPPNLQLAPGGLDHSGLHRMWLRMQGNRGDLQVRSSPGHGTCVRFSLPLAPIRSQAP